MAPKVERAQRVQLHPAANVMPTPAGLTAGASSSLIILASIAVVVALHLGREVFLPLSLAMLIAFALSPPVTWIRKLGAPMIVSVLLVATMAFAIIGIFALIVGAQFAELARELPRFQGNILSKLADLQASTPENGLIARLTRMATVINEQITSALPTDPGGAPADAAPVQVEVIERQGAVETMMSLASPLIKPVATTGIVIVVVIFMLLEREELRDRFIRLVGAHDINRTTQVIEDAGNRVGTYLLMQLVVNVIYAVPIGVGLWLIGVPNALLWGMLTLVLRFVPYIGPILSAVFPLFLAFAVSPGWSTVLWTAGLFLTVELISSNVIEPRLYGSRTGVSALAIIVAAIFWTAVWGPMGLVLSTPLTVCLVVVGRYLPQFTVFEVMFGDRPALAPHSHLYQRLLVGDPVESTLRAEELLEDVYLSDYHRDVGLPALVLAQADLEAGALAPEQQSRFVDAATQFLQELDPVVLQELAEAGGNGEPDGATGAEMAVQASATGKRILTLGGRTQLDDLAAHAFAQMASSEGAEVTLLSHVDLTPSRFGNFPLTDEGCIVLHFLDVAPSRASLLHIRRLKRAAPQMRVGIVIHQQNDATQPLVAQRRVSQAKKAEVMDVGADFCATSLDEALAMATMSDAPRPVVEPVRRRRARIDAFPRAVGA